MKKTKKKTSKTNITLWIVAALIPLFVFLDRNGQDHHMESLLKHVTETHKHETLAPLTNEDHSEACLVLAKQQTDAHHKIYEMIIFEHHEDEIREQQEEVRRHGEMQISAGCSAGMILWLSTRRAHFVNNLVDDLQDAARKGVFGWR